MSAAAAIPYEPDHPPEAPYAEWRDWSLETRYLFVERLNMGADKAVALKQARRNHMAEGGRLF